MALSVIEKEGLKFWPYCRSKCPPGKGCKARKSFETLLGESTGEGWHRLKQACRKR